jgi:DNA-binding XRE family transcriptional regulator
MTLSERIAYLSEREKSQAEFSRKVGINRATINRIIKEGSGMSNTSLELVLKAYPKLSARWLLTGEGEMWAEGPAGELEACREEVARLEKEVARLEQENKRIYGNIEDIRKLNDYLEKDNERLLEKLGLK